MNRNARTGRVAAVVWAVALLSGCACKEKLAGRLNLDASTPENRKATSGTGNPESRQTDAVPADTVPEG